MDDAPVGEHYSECPDVSREHTALVDPAFDAVLHSVDFSSSELFLGADNLVGRAVGPHADRVAKVEGFVLGGGVGGIDKGIDEAGQGFEQTFTRGRGRRVGD